MAPRRYLQKIQTTHYSVIKCLCQSRPTCNLFSPIEAALTVFVLVLHILHFWSHWFIYICKIYGQQDNKRQIIHLPGCSSNAYNSQYWAKLKPGTQSSFPHRYQVFNYLSHYQCLLGSMLRESWSQLLRLQPGIELKTCRMEQHHLNSWDKCPNMIWCLTEIQC